MSNKLVYVPISDFGKIITGKTPKTDVLELWDGEVPFITPTDIPTFDTKYLLTTERTISEIGVASQKKMLLPVNSLCVSCIATIGKLCLTRVPSITNQQINSIVINSNYNPFYLLYTFRYYLPYLQLIGGGTGSGTPIINKNKFSKLKYPVFQDINIQNKIATTLDNYDQLIENNTKRINVLECLIEAIYKEWFIRFRFPGYKEVSFKDKIPVGWEYKKFSDIYSFIRGVSYSSDEIDCEDGINMINLKNINSYGGFRRDGLKKYNGDYKEKQKVSYGDLIMGVTDMTQDRRTVGWTGLVPDIEGVISMDLVIIKSEINNRFSQCLFKYGFYSKLFSQFGNGANVIHLKPDALRNQKILIPDNKFINKFVDLVNPFFDEIENLYKQNEALSQSRDSLLPRLMSGKLSVEGKEIV